MTLFDKQTIFAENVQHLIWYIGSIGHRCTLGEVYRTKEQAEIYVKAGKGILDSLHCKKLAIDINIFDNQGNYLTDIQSLEPFGKYWESLNKLNRWGGRFKELPDADHFEMQDL